MRLATVLAEDSATPVAAVSVDARHWVGLHAFLSFFDVEDLPSTPAAPLSSFLPGDVIELEIERIGVLRTRVTARPE
jgi:hypothetical protein